MTQPNFSVHSCIKISAATSAWNVSDGSRTEISKGQYTITGQEETIDGIILLEVNNAWRIDADELEAAA